MLLDIPTIRLAYIFFSYSLFLKNKIKPQVMVTGMHGHHSKHAQYPVVTV